MRGILKKTLLLLMLSFIFMPFGIKAHAEDKVTITFDYGLNQEYCKENQANDKYPKSADVDKGASKAILNDVVGLPQSGDAVGDMTFDYWSLDENGDESIWGYEFEADITLYAHWTHAITYDPGEGHFYGQEAGEKYVSNWLSEENTILDISPYCYPASNDKAFIGWSLEPDGEVVTELGFSPSVYQNITVYAVYTDGYPVTFNANGGTINQYYESYIDWGDYYRLGSLRSYDKSTLTITYPKEYVPSEAPYMCYMPIYDNSYVTPNTADKEFKNWTSDESGDNDTSFYTYSPKKDGTDTFYAKWSKYFTVTFDGNRGRTDDTVEKHVIDGYSLHSIYIPYDSFKSNGKRCSSFNESEDGKGVVVDYDYVPTDDITVYAQYTDTYEITLDPDSDHGGYLYSGYSSFTIDQGDKLETDFMDRIVLWPDDSTGPSNKVLDYWCFDKDGDENQRFKPPYTPDADVTLYAIPEKGSIVTFHAGANEDDESNQYGTVFSFRGKGPDTDISVAYSKKRPIGDDYPNLANYVNDDTKEFAGWSTEYGDLTKRVDFKTFIPKDDKINLYAVWYDKVPVRYHANGGEFEYISSKDKSIYSTYVKEGDRLSISQSEIPTMAGAFAFVGWSETEGSSKTIPQGTIFTVSKPMDFYAVWEPGYVITLDGNGGEVFLEGSGHSHQQGETPTLTIKKGSSVISDDSKDYFAHGYKDGFILEGFSTTQNGQTLDLTKHVPEGDETLYAIWGTPCIVTYDPGESGTLYDNEKTEEVVKGGKVWYLPTPQPTGEENFVGWFTADDKRFTTSTIVNDNITVKAKWTSDKVTVILDAGEKGTILPEDPSDTPQRKVELVLPKGGYLDLPQYVANSTDENEVFGGWKSETITWDSSNKNGIDVNESITFEAIWNQAVYIDVTFNGNGGLVDFNDNPGEPEDDMDFRIIQGDSIGTDVYAYQTGEGKEGLVFTGWYKDASATTLVAAPGKIKDYVPAENGLILYAGWKDNTVKVTGIKLEKENLNLGVSGDVADTYQLKAIIYPSNATNTKVTYESDAPGIAKVTEDGLVTAVKASEDPKNPNTATITVTTADGGFKASCKVTIRTLTAGAAGDKLDDITDKITNAADANTAQKELKNQLQGMGGVDRIADLADNESVSQKLNDLEDAYKVKANVDVVEPDNESKQVLASALGVASANDVEISGAALNANPNTNVSLNVEAVPDDQKAPVDETQYENAQQVNMNLTVTGKNGENPETVEELISPVTLKLPIPKNMNTSKLYILHFNKEKNKYEILRPVFKNGAMYFTVSHFSTFVFVELASGTAIDNGGGNQNNNDPANPDNPTPAPTPDPTPTPTPTPDPAPAADISAPVGTTTDTTNGSYVVSGNFEVTFNAAKDKKAKKAKIDSTVTIEGKEYKVTAIKSGAFKNCKKLTSVTIPSSVTEIGANAFAGCKELKKVTIPAEVTSIGKNAFKGCSKLSKVTIKSTSITSIGKNAFKGIKKGATIKVPKSKKKDYQKLLKKAKVASDIKIK
ncbi:leucine-rich repeat protein [Butyrivibrio sp. VCD2006]|uniref:leucine-rich repeat protein n=1 Tax=Butyrivibrio sp. VCD2006 TaxID=1280664 RepID=UPI000427BD06|nr:leucine-rich repeat protein [Butyrivibrio sp. VCD2006]